MARFAVVCLASLLAVATPGISSADHERELSFLADMKQLEQTGSYGSWSHGDVTVNGQLYTSSMYRRVYYGGDEETVSFDLGRSWQSFDATLGLRDDADAGGSVTFQVFKDGALALTQTATLGQAVPIQVDVNNVLRMKIRVSAPDDGPSGEGYAVWGSARVSRPKAHGHGRTISFSLKGRKAKGKVTATDGFAQCQQGVPVEIERADYSGWETIRTLQTDGSGNFKTRVPKSGSFRATAPSLEMGVPWPSDACDKKSSRKRSNY